uniref:ANK_REP_REGION domain-containing protein n=1 Tax=Macrostomum lignano TaxID=282301 RepID=A0A1I8HVN7_9PLAT
MSVSVEEKIGIEAAIVDLRVHKAKAKVAQLKAALAEQKAEVRRLRAKLAKRPEIRVWNQRLRRLQGRYDKLRAEHAKRQAFASSASRRRDLRLRRANSRSKSSQLATERVKELRADTRSLHGLICEANEKLQQQSVGSIITKTSRPSGGQQYTNQVISTCMHLVLDCHVPVQHVKPAIRRVLTDLVGIDAGNLALPSRSQVSALSYSLGSCLAKASAMEKLLHQGAKEDRPITILHDATSKKGRHYAAYQVDTGDSRPMAVSLREVEGGTANIYARELDYSVEELVDLFCSVVLAHSSDEERRRLKCNLLARVNFLMTDRHVVNKCLNVLLNEMRQELATQQGVNPPPPVTALFCGMHVIVNLAAAAEAALREWETCMAAEAVGSAALPGFRPSQAESGTQRLIRTVCKAFHALGSEQCGVAIPLQTYLESKGAPSLRLDDFRGNRAYITFPNGGNIFWQRDRLSEFLAEYTCSNRLLIAVQADLASDLLLSGCRALGIADVLLIRPLWVLLRCRDVTLTDMNERYERACNWLRQLSSSEGVTVASSMIGPFPELAQTVLRDIQLQDIWAALTSELTALENEIVGQALQIMATHMLVLLEREVRDHLPGGTLRQLTPEVAQLVSSAPKDNVAVERGFGMLDKCVADRPNMRPLARESLVLFGYNCTSEWLADKTEREKDLLLTRARKLVPQLEKRGKESADALRSCRQEILRAKLAEKQRKKDSNAESIRSILRVIEAYGGLWPTISRMDAVLHQLAPDQHEKAIKAQLQLHKATKIHLPKDKASLLNFSAAGVKRSVPQLRSQLREVLQIVELQDQQKGADAPTVPPSGLLDARERKERVRTAIADRLQRHGEDWIPGHVLQRLPSTCQSRDILSQEFKVVFDDFEGDKGTRGSGGGGSSSGGGGSWEHDFSYCGVDRDVAEYYRPSAAHPSTLQAADLRLHLEHRVAMLPGGRDRRGGPIMCFPGRADTEKIPVDELMRLVKYLSYVPDARVRSLRFTVVIDMRHAAWSSIKPILKILDETLSDSLDITYVIKPESFIEKQRVQMAIGKYSFDIKLVSIEGLFGDIDPAQLTTEFDGSLPFDSKEFVELPLSSFFFRSHDMSEKLTKLYHALDHRVTPATLQQAVQMVEMHRAQKNKSVCNRIYVFKSDRLSKLQCTRWRPRAARLAQWLRCGSKGESVSSSWVSMNTDFQQLAPAVTDAIQHLYELRSLLVDKWESTRVALEQAYQLRLFEEDVGRMANWQQQRTFLLDCFGDIGQSAQQVSLHQVLHCTTLCHAALHCTTCATLCCTASKGTRGSGGGGSSSGGGGSWEHDFAYCGVDRDVAEYYRPSAHPSTLQAADLRLHLEHRVAMPGGRDRRGGPIMCFPGRADTEKIPVDELMRLVKYLSYVPDARVRSLRFTVVIDMRHAAWSSIKPILKILDETLSDSLDITYVIKPESFIEKQRVQMAIGKYSFDIKLVSIEGLFGDIDPAQLTTEFDGSLPFDSKEFVELRCRLESFFFRSHDMSEKLTKLYHALDHRVTPATLQQAVQMVEMHRAQKNKVVQAPVHSLEAEAARLAQWLRCGSKGESVSSSWVSMNTDFQQLAPAVTDAIQHLYELRSLLVDKWESTRVALEQAYQLRLFEEDVGRMANWMQQQRTFLLDCFGDIGQSAQQ